MIIESLIYVSWWLWIDILRIQEFVCNLCARKYTRLHQTDQFSNALNLTLKVKYTWAEYAAQPTIESKHLGWDFQPLSRRLQAKSNVWKHPYNGWIKAGYGIQTFGFLLGSASMYQVWVFIVPLCFMGPFDLRAVAQILRDHLIF